MFRNVVLATFVVAGCGGPEGDDTCGELMLELAEDVEAYPTTAAIGCDLPTGGWWDKTKNEAAIRLTGSDLPEDAYIVAVMTLDMVKPGASLSVPTGLAGQAYTNGTKNHANLTSGTVQVISDLDIDHSVPARVFKVQWDLTWLGSGVYRSQGEGRVWFSIRGAL